MLMEVTFIMEEAELEMNHEEGTQKVTLELDYDRTVNYAMQQNDVPVVKALRILNGTDSTLRDLVIRITTEPVFATPWESRVTSIKPNESYNLGVIDLPLSHDFLAGFTERVAGTLLIEVLQSTTVLSTTIQRIDVLAYDEWNGLQSIPEILAAFVTPNHPVVESLLSDAAGILGTWTGNSAISGYQSHDSQRAAYTTAAIYTAIQQRNIRYINPPASFEETGQKIRLPDRILESRLATCLDLTVLSASCMEQAGLHPLIVITAGHAFVGVWFEDETFADVATDDLLRLRKRVELGQITLFETTLLTSEPVVPFEQAVKEALKHLEKEADFRYVLDIRRARKSRIRPLPLRIELSTAVSAAEEIESDPIDALKINLPTFDTLPEKQPEVVVETPATRLDRWKRKLLDLTLNNRQLNFRESKKNLPILCPDLGSLEDALADGKTFKIFPRIEDLGESDSRNADVHRSRTGKESLNEMLREELLARRIHANVSDAEISKRLLEIYREAKLSIEENGANTLYLALGFLAWYETATSPKQRLAPIILIPLEIERRSVQEGFSIKMGDDEPMVNVTLLAHLAADFELTIPGLDPIPMDDHGIDVALILRKFREAIVDIDRWEVLETVFIGHFSFAKFLMWRDLEVRSDDLQKNAIVRHLIHTPSEAYPDDGVFPDPDRLDETHSLEETFCPLSSDSSQLAAIHASAAGKSFVLHGPPGTGKSQTITNIIAHNLALGKTVLFVSEKRAALEVVHRRLTESGLGPFCLELHSNKSHKKGVLKQLEQSIDAHVRHSSEEWLEQAQKLAVTRKELNDFVSALHAVRESGESVFHGISQLIGHRDIPLIKLQWPSVAHIDRQKLNNMREVVRQLQLAGAQIGHPATSAWANTACDEWSPEFRSNVEQNLRELITTVNSLSETAFVISPMLGVRRDGWSRDEFKNLVLITDALITCPSMPAAFLVSQDWGQLKGTIQRLVPHGIHRDNIRNILLSRYGEGILALDLDDLTQKWGEVEQARFLPQWLGFGNDWSCIDLDNQTAISTTIINSPSVPSSILSSNKWYELKVSVLKLVDHGRQRNNIQNNLFSRYGEGILALNLEELSKKWEAVEQARFLPQWLGYGDDWSRNELGNQAEITFRILKNTSMPSPILTSSKWEELKTSVLELTEYEQQRDKLQQKLFNRYGKDILTLDLAELAKQWEALQKVWVLPKFLGCRKILKTLSHVSVQGVTPKPVDVLSDLELAQAYIKAKEAFKKAEIYLNELLNKYWNRDRAIWVEVRQAVIGVAQPDHVPNDTDIAADLELASALRKENQSVAIAQAQLIGELNQCFNRDKAVWEHVRKALSGVALSGELPLDDVVKSDLEMAVALRSEEQFLNTSAPWAKEVLEQQWNWSVAERCLEKADILREIAAKVSCGDTAQASRYCQTWVPLVKDGNESLALDGSIGQRLMEYKTAFTSFCEAEDVLVALLVTEAKSAWCTTPSSSDYLNAIMERCNQWHNNLNGLRAWCFWRSVRKEALALNLLPLVEAYESQALATNQLQDAFSRGYYQWWCDANFGVEPALRGFFSSAFEDKIRQFKKIDEKYTLLTRKEIQARVAARLPKGQANNPNSEMGLLRRQMQRKVGHMPVRSLIQKIPNLLPRLKPCLLMSPISVAQYLDPSHTTFDLVVFDEASQIPVWDAVGVIARANEAIIVGDPKQLPPTNFFSRSDSGDDADADDNLVEDLESILDDCIAAQLPERHLNWHYRSRHESLIAFSNYHYYGNRLFTFPSPHQELGVSFRHVRGEYDKGKSRTNRAEATAIVQEVLVRLLDPCRAKFSIGIVTFSQAQQQLIDDLLEEARRQNPEIETYFSDGAIEPLFIKNLENVQGDERDVILFSICYGPDSSGKVSMNFGPMNRDGGERRLNVAITRARQEVIVFSTLRAEHIDLSKTRAQGVADLKCFLDYAERGPIAISERRSNDGEGECESPFEVQVCDALRSKGYTVHPQVGCSGYRIDLGVVDQDRPGRYMLGIECDGANYHRSKTARDRDKLRESILTGLGWTIHRVWSTDWWERPAEELARIEAAIEATRQTIHVPETIAEPATQLIASAPSMARSAPSAERLQSAPLQHSASREPALPEYEPFVVTGINGSPDDFYDQRSDRSIRALIEMVVRTEGPVSIDLVARRVSEHWGVGRVTSRTLKRIEELAGKTAVTMMREVGGTYLWAASQDPKTYSLFRVIGENENSKRAAEHLPPQEVANAVFYVLEQHVSIPVADLVRETARLFGYQRTGPAVDKAMRGGIRLLVKNGGAKEDDGMVVHQESF
jgi:very-short-patch-repair endonuclease